MKTRSLVKRFEEIVSSLCFGVMILVVAMQVFNRYVLQNSLDWSEELGRYLFIWGTYVGCSFAMQEDRHLEVTVIRNYLSPKLKKLMVSVAYVLTICFCLICTVYGIKMLLFLAGTGQKTPALEIKMYWIYASIPLGMGLMALRTSQRLWRMHSPTGSHSQADSV